MAKAFWNRIGRGLIMAPNWPKAPNISTRNELAVVKKRVVDCDPRYGSKLKEHVLPFSLGTPASFYASGRCAETGTAIRTLRPG